MKPLRLLLALLLVAPLALIGCDAGDPAGGGADDAPPVLSPEAFVYDDSFPEADGNARLIPGENFLNAYARVVLVSIGVGIHLVIPAAATEAATDEDPFVESGTWIWENSVDIEGNDIDFRLEATPDGTEIDWRMIVTSEEPIDGQVYDDFVLYEATTSLNGREGTWSLYYLIEGERVRVLDADFAVSSESVREITFTVSETNPDPETRGSSVRYARDGNYRLFDWHQKPEEFDHLVEWDIETKAGAITATNYNDGQQACWDEQLEDVACTE